jgi:hypothetical protein
MKNSWQNNERSFSCRTELQELLSFILQLIDVSSTSWDVKIVHDLDVVGPFKAPG